MKKIKIFTTAVLAGFVLIGLSSCKENARTMNKNYAVSAFNAIESEIVGNVVFTQSDDIKVSAEGSEILVKNLIVEVDGEKLKLSAGEQTLGKLFGFNKKRKLTVYVSAPNISRIDLEGVSNLKLSGNVKSDSLFIDLDGVGNLKAEDLECRDLSVESSGVGNISLKGRAESLRIKSDDVGNIDAEEFLANIVSVSSSGVGNVKFYASDSLSITASGVGNITYFGNPAAKTIDNSGVGKVRNGDD